MALFVMLYKVIQAFGSVDKILNCDHSNESYSEQYFPVAVFVTLYKVDVLPFESMDVTLKCDLL